jgi:hypothetical protein
VNVNGSTVIVVEDTGTLDLNDTGSKIYTTAGKVTLIGITAPTSQEAQEAHYSSNGVAGTTGVLFHQGEGAGAVSGSKYIIAGNATQVLAGGSLAATGTGTIGIVIGAASNDNAAYDIQGGGSLVVTGKMDLGSGYVQTYGLLDIKGALSGGTLNSASEVIKGGSQVTALSANITGGKINNPLLVKSASTFGKTTGGALVTLGGTLTTPDNSSFVVTFDSDAEFEAPSYITKGKFNGDAKFTGGGSLSSLDIASGKKITGGQVYVVNNVTATGGLKFGSEGGAIIPANTFNGFIDGSYGTFAAVGNDEVTVSVTNGALKVTGDGTLSIPSATLITLTGANTFVFDNKGGIKFPDDADSKITGEDGYQFGGTAGILYSPGGSAVTLGNNSITKGDGTAPTIMFSGGAGAGGSFLTVFAGSTVIISDANIAVSGGTISVGEGSASIILGAGGSITAADVAYGGTIVSDITTGVGSLVAGSAGYANIGAGSLGTTGSNFILSASKFNQVSLSGSDIATAVGSASNNPNADVTTVGSIAVFTNN